MPRGVAFDEIHVTFRIPDELPEDQREELHRTLIGEDFMTRLRRAIRGVIRTYPELAIVRVSLSR